MVLEVSQRRFYPPRAGENETVEEPGEENPNRVIAPDPLRTDLPAPAQTPAQPATVPATPEPVLVPAGPLGS